MLYPDFDELVSLGHRASLLEPISAQRSWAAASGNYASPFRGQGLAFHEVRDYRFGDDIRSIDWRVTARTNKPHIKVFTEERERTVILCIDANVAMRFGTRGTFKSVQAARAAALLGWQANGSNDRVGCIVFGLADGVAFFRPTRSRQALWQTLKLLSAPAQVSPDAPVAPDTALHYLEPMAPRGALIFMISDFQNATDLLERRLGDIRRKCDIVLVAISDPADREIPAMETVIFSDHTGQKLVLDTDNAAGRATYARQWQDNRARLEEIAARKRIGIVDLHTDKDVYDELLPGLRRLNIKRDRR